MNPGSLSNQGETEKSRNLDPSILGVPKSHGVKLSLMTSEDKKQFLLKLEEWRKARKEKLAAKILAKQKVVDKPKLPVNFTSKTKSAIPSSGGIPRPQNGESVFERLYKSNSKLRKPEATKIPNKSAEAQNIKKDVSITASKSLKVSETDTLPHENSKVSACESFVGDSLNDLTNLSSGLEIKLELANTKSEIQKPIEQPSTESQSNFKVVSLCSEQGNPEVSSLRNENTELENPKIDGSPTFTEPKNVAQNMGGKIPTKKLKMPLRRSISMSFRQKSKAKNMIKRSLSAKNIQELQGDMGVSANGNKLSSVNEPVAKSATTKTKRLFSSAHLRSKLEDWLKVNGHSLEGYRHLRCFGVNDSAVLQQASSVQRKNYPENSDFSTSPGLPSDEMNKENITPSTGISQVDVMQVENWLKELHMLITKMKYPSERCEEWLAAIKKKYPKCSQLPIYWECLASLNECKGDIKSAIEDYERAIIEGGQIESVGNSLAELFDKMVIEQKKPMKSKIDKGIDPKNIFKSTVIKFALQQKTPKKVDPQLSPSLREQLYIATPVRRSSRIQTLLSSKEVASLETLTPDVKKNLTFKLNESLLEAD